MFDHFLRPSAMMMNDGVESMIQHLVKMQWSVEVGENDVEERGVE
jgi:hypothetical protein